ncbi:electron transport complex subunit G [Dissulfurispira thermophila]|uniref:Ion-translocating oxidoreductase complex subunit G n=1 Tax=Dissulfurispira thermophila TaxID=2715679 RepID=A0A7G1H3D4_9BACT|nr:RnfABCDGE type electron transport complex subunit G [Dissulfurispira thermophila]BCB97324.1 electron transport complex subunit G [Dissulfurispira thermophila]
MTGKDIIKITINLVVIYLIGGAILAAVYATTSPVIFKNNEEAKKQALRALMPEADDIKKMGDWTIHEKHAEYFVAKKGDDIVGYIVQSFGKGYSSYIDTLIAVDKDFKVQKINILHHAETPGLGDEIETDSFKGQFKGKDFDHLKVLKTETTEYIQAISGATISSRAVTEDAVKSGVDFLMKTIKGGAENGSADRKG